MDRLANLRRRIILHPEPGSFTAEGESARWSNKDLDPVPQENKKWEWYHVGGFWIAEGRTRSDPSQRSLTANAVDLDQVSMSPSWRHRPAPSP